MIETKDEAPEATNWTGKSSGDVPVKQTIAPPVPMEVAAAQEPPKPAPEPAKPTVIAPDSGYAVFFFPAAIEALGAVVSPYLDTENGEPHMRCLEVDTGGAFIEVTLEVADKEGVMRRIELMFPASMVRLIMSVHSDGTFGFARPASPINY
ncbi:hypothetical protein [Solilutibacter tolerans]|uniref:Uncharacterized protein n=1 Tax=Solilutibacter tolerans TaxID=1604334 RepID=A0A1N6PJM1_9GAMM|nr:hypothetical protein [Lysobacter tolerans]SIQ04453.1 hypothetical protein SAMN05421546_0639 [Lysobacter tolerans]